MSSNSDSDSECDDGKLERVPVPKDFFKDRSEAKKDGNSLYKCMHCAAGPNKTRNAGFLAFCQVLNFS